MIEFHNLEYLFLNHFKSVPRFFHIFGVLFTYILLFQITQGRHYKGYTRNAPYGAKRAPDDPTAYYPPGPSSYYSAQNAPVYEGPPGPPPYYGGQGGTHDFHNIIIIISLFNRILDFQSLVIIRYIFCPLIWTVRYCENNDVIRYFWQNELTTV